MEDYKTIQTFDDFYLYDSIMSSSTRKLETHKYKVLREIIFKDANKSVYLIEDKTGRKSTISKEMFHRTQDTANIELLDYLISSRNRLSDDILILQTELQVIEDAVLELKSKFK